MLAPQSESSAQFPITIGYYSCDDKNLSKNLGASRGIFSSYSTVEVSFQFWFNLMFFDKQEHDLTIKYKESKDIK